MSPNPKFRTRDDSVTCEQHAAFFLYPPTTDQLGLASKVMDHLILSTHQPSVYFLPFGQTSSTTPNCISEFLSNSTTVRERRQSPSEISSHVLKGAPTTSGQTCTVIHTRGALFLCFIPPLCCERKERLFCDSTIGRTLPYESESDLPIRVCPFFSPLCSLADPSLRFLPLEKN